MYEAARVTKPPDQRQENDLLPQNLLHRFSFCEFINQLVQVSYLLHQRIIDFLYTNTTHRAFDKPSCLDE